MAIFKPSNFYPNLQEVDIETNNTFSCQVNTSGTSVKAYKYKILSANDNTEVYTSNCVNLVNPVKNKNFLNIENISASLSQNLTNGKNYKWYVRTYDALSGSNAMPNTIVCNGFLVGSTKYVFWTANNQKIERDRWIEFSTVGSSGIMDILPPNDENIVKPESGITYRERHQISYVTKELGFNKDYTKIETDEDFKYNYVDGTSFSLYQCSDEHGYNNFFIDPNDKIELGYYIQIFSGASSTIKESYKKVVGYSPDTGEVRVQEKFTAVPVNGDTYKLYTFASQTGAYTEVTFSGVSNLIGGQAITDASFTIKTNKWTNEEKRIFIQPNTNIKSDDTNPNEIVFSNGVRLDITKTTSTELVPGKTVDITIDKLDNTQWLLKFLSAAGDSVPPIIPKSTYTIYTDFMDSSPESLFYCRATPSLNIQFKNYNAFEGNFENITTTPRGYRDVTFYTQWSSSDNVQIKYYKYTLYDEDGNEIKASDNCYDTDMLWNFRGLETGTEISPQKYSIKVEVADEYGSVFTKTEDFYIYYIVETGIVPLDVQFNCETKSNDIIATVPGYAQSVSVDGKESVTISNIVSPGMMVIGKNEILNYARTTMETFVPISIPKTFGYFAEFKIGGNFIDNFISQKEVTLTEIKHTVSEDVSDTFYVKLNSFDAYIFNDNILTANPDKFKIKVYKNDNTTPLNCFENGTRNYFDISEADLNSDFKYATDVSYMLKDPSAGYLPVTELPLMGETGVKYILHATTPQHLKGVYMYINNAWVADYSVQYVYIENLSQVSGGTYSNLEVPEDCIGEDGEILYTEFSSSEDTESNVWIDTCNYCNEYNKIILGGKWLTLYLTVDNSGESEEVNCYMTISNNRLGGGASA